MDFLALPRRDLQALCKRNGVRANMTSAAMADALRALPKVGGIEEYVKQPAPVPQPEVEAVVEEEQNVGKKGNLLPRSRGRRVVAKSSEPIEAKEDKEEEKGNAKRQSSKEDALAPGVARRGASRRARPVPVVPQSSAVAEEEGQAEEDLMREAKRNKAPAPVAGRRGASRRARPSPAMAAQEDESEVAGAEEEKREEVEDPKRKATMDDVPALGVGRRGGARAVPSVSAMAGKVVAEEEQGAQIPCGRRVRAKGTSTSSEPIRLDDSDDEEQEDAKPEEQQEDAQIRGVGRRGGASRRGQAAPVPRGRRGKANSAELIRMDDIKEREHTKPEAERGDVPAIAVGWQGASRRAPAPSEAPATRRSAASSKVDAVDVAVEAVPIRATRQRKPTMKAAAAAAAEEKAPRRGTRRGEVMSALLQQEVHEEPHEAVGAPNMAVEVAPIRATRQRKPTLKAAAAATTEEKAPPRATRRGAVMRTILQPKAQEEPQVSYQRCDALEAVSDPQEEELNEMEAQNQDQDQDQNMVIIIEDEKLMEEIIAEESSLTNQAQEEPQEEICEVDTQEVSKEKEHTDIAELHADIVNEVAFLDCLSNISQVSEEVINEKLNTAGVETNVEVNAEDDLSCQEEGDVVVDNVDSVDNTILLDFSSDISWVEIEKAGNVTSSEMHENTAALDEDGDKLNEVVIGDNMSQDAVTDKVVQEEKGVLITDEMLQGIAGMHDDIKDDQIETIFIHVDQVVTADSLLEQMTDNEAINEKVNTTGDQTNMEVNAEDGFGCQEEEGDVVVDDKVDSVDNTILLDCSSDISCVEMEKAGNIRSEMPENTAALDEDGDKPNEVVICDTMSQVTVTDEVVHEEKEVLITDGMHDDIEDDQFETVFAQIDQVVTDDSLLEQMTDDEAINEMVHTAGEETNMEVNAEDGLGCQEEDVAVVDKVDLVDKTILLDCSCEISWVEMEETGNITSEMHENTAALDEDGDKLNEVIIGDNISQDAVTDEVVQEEKGVLITDEMLQGIAGMHDDIKDDQFETVFAQIDQVVIVDSLLEQMTDDEAINEMVHTAGEETNMEVNAEDGLGCQEEEDAVVDKVDSVDKTILLDCSCEIRLFEMEKTGNVTSEMPENRAALDEDGDEQVEVITTDKKLELTGSNVENVGEKNSAKPMAVLEEKGAKVASEGEDLNKLSLAQLRAKYKEKMIAKKNKEAKKRVALARVDENVCRSHAKEHQQNRNLQQH